MAATVKSLDDRIDDLAGDLTAFKSKIETIVALQKWIGVFGAGIIVTLMFNGFSIANTAGKLEATVVQLQGNVKALEDLIRRENSSNQERDRRLEQIATEMKFLNERTVERDRRLEQIAVEVKSINEKVATLTNKLDRPRPE